jgi:hypothetical protein
MNDAVDMEWDVCMPSAGCDQDLTAMLKELISPGVSEKACGTFMTRAGPSGTTHIPKGARRVLNKPERQVRWKRSTGWR